MPGNGVYISFFKNSECAAIFSTRDFVSKLGYLSYQKKSTIQSKLNISTEESGYSESVGFNMFDSDDISEYKSYLYYMFSEKLKELAPNLEVDGQSLPDDGKENPWSVVEILFSIQVNVQICNVLNLQALGLS